MLPRTDTVLSLLPLRSAHPDHGAAVRILNSPSPLASLPFLPFFLLSDRCCLESSMLSRVFVRFHCTIGTNPDLPTEIMDQHGYLFIFFHGLIYPFHLFHSQPFYTSFHRALLSVFIIMPLYFFIKRRFQLGFTRSLVHFLIAERIISSVFPSLDGRPVLLSHVFFSMTVIW